MPRLIHAADLHCGFFRHDRTTASGRNQRQDDVHAQLCHFIDRCIEIEPNVIIIAGDVFHQARPSNPVIIETFAQFRRLRRYLPETAVIMVAGNHDQSRSGEECILNLFREIGFVVVDREPEAHIFGDFGLSVMCVPEVKALETPLAPNPAYRFNVLAIHGEIRGLIKGSRAQMTYEASELAAGGWDYVALGHYHEQQEIAPRVWYAGAIDHTSNDVWHEGKDKGFLEVDLETGNVFRHALPAPRPHISIEIDGAGLSVEELNDRISEETYKVNVVDKVVRVVLLNVDNATKRAIDPKMQRELRAIATHFAIENRAPEGERELIVGFVPRAQSLETELRAKLETIAIADTIDRPEFVGLGLKYFERTHSEAA